MSRVEADREDLFAEATGLVPRVRLIRDGAEIVAGLRPTGRFTAYLRAELMLDFDAEDRWRRAFADGLLFRAGAEGRVVRLVRDRTDGGTTLLARELSRAEGAALLAKWRDALADALAEYRAGGWVVDAAAGFGEPAAAAEAVFERWARIAARPAWSVAPALR